MSTSTTPRVGQWADHHSGELDPRRVAAVSPEGRLIKLDIMGSLTPWLPAANYTYKEPTQ